MSKNKLHWQVDWRIGENNSIPEIPNLAICGAMHPDFARKVSDVTCIRCAKRIIKISSEGKNDKQL